MEAVRPKALMYVEELAACSPWTASAIHTMIDDGVFQKGVHFHQPHGSGSRIIFEWERVYEYVTGRRPLPAPRQPVARRPAPGRVQFDEKKAQTATSRLRA